MKIIYFEGIKKSLKESRKNNSKTKIKDYFDENFYLKKYNIRDCIVKLERFNTDIKNTNDSNQSQSNMDNSLIKSFSNLENLYNELDSNSLNMLLEESNEFVLELEESVTHFLLGSVANKNLEIPQVL